MERWLVWQAYSQKDKNSEKDQSFLFDILIENTYFLIDASSFLQCADGSYPTSLQSFR